MEYTLENLEKAVTLFYRSEAGQQAEAHQWLTEAQNSPQAWSFVWELLHPSRVRIRQRYITIQTICFYFFQSSEVQFFAATTLHTKLLKNWNEVPEDHYEVLKKRILEAIINYAMGPKIVLNRLCITVIYCKGLYLCGLLNIVVLAICIHYTHCSKLLAKSF